MEVHKTKVRINLVKLRQVVEELHKRYLEIGHRDTTEGRSRFSAWNNINHKLQELDNGSESVVVELTGAAKGNSSRVYYTPSLTSLSKEFRKCIEPVNPGFKIMYFDCKAAEFFMNCVYCNETEALEAYARGEDIYMKFAHIFPFGTSREVIKRCLIGNMYGITPYRVSQQTGISEAMAERLLRVVAQSMTACEFAKAKRIMDARRNKFYVSPHGFDQSKLERVAEIDPKKGFQPNLALSAYVQSGLGFWMQDMIHKVQPRCRGMLLSTFDAMFIEFAPENEERLKNYLRTAIAPFRADFHSGSTMWEAQYEH